MLAFLWRASKGYRLAPWRSPFLRWRIETYYGTPADKVSPADFWQFVWGKRSEFLRFLRWARENRSR